MLARPSIAIDRTTSVAAGNLLIIGINEPHPRPTLDHYERTFVTPYAGPRSAQSPPGALFALPGYHRSESGIAHFETLFCAARSRASRGTGLAFGGWSTHQREKFFAIALPHGWWLWGVDIRYGQPLEAKQFNYFTVISENLTDQSKVMLFTPHENWLRSDFDDWAEQANLQKIIAIVEASGARVAAIITGGDHEYAHAATDTSVQIFEIGGGRRFVEPSHLEPRRTLLRWWTRNSANGAATPSQKTAELPPPAQRRDRNAYDKALEFWILAGRSARNARLVARLAVANVINAASRPPPELDANALSGERQSAGVGARLLQFFPRRRQSARLALRNLLFPFANPSLALAIGVAYWFVTWQFQTMVSQYSISGGRIDLLGINTTLAEVIPYLPFYIVQAMIVSLSFILMLALPYAALLAYAGKAQSTLWGRLAGYAAGSAHFFAHVVAMFCLALFVVSFNNSVTPAVERQLESIYRERQQQAPLVRDVIQESLEPLQRRQRPVEAQQPASPSAVREVVGFILYPILMIGIGMFLGGFVTGLHLTITSFFARHFAHRAFAVLGISGFRSFLASPSMPFGCGAPT